MGKTNKEPESEKIKTKQANLLGGGADEKKGGGRRPRRGKPSLGGKRPIGKRSRKIKLEREAQANPGRIAEHKQANHGKYAKKRKKQVSEQYIRKGRFVKDQKHTLKADWRDLKGNHDRRQR